MTRVALDPDDGTLDEQEAAPSLQRSTAPLRALAAAENLLVMGLLAATVLVILAQVFWRYVLDQPLSWSNEIATDLLVYIALVGFAIAVRDNGHVAMRLFERRLGARTQDVLRGVELLVLGAVTTAIGVGGAQYAIEQRDVHSPIDVPLWIPFAALPLGCGLGMVHLVVEVVGLALRFRRGATPEDAGATVTGGVA